MKKNESNNLLLIVYILVPSMIVVLTFLTCVAATIIKVSKRNKAGNILITIRLTLINSRRYN